MIAMSLMPSQTSDSLALRLSIIILALTGKAMQDSNIAMANNAK
jgi:hypothetical protein